MLWFSSSLSFPHTTKPLALPTPDTFLEQTRLLSDESNSNGKVSRRHLLKNAAVAATVLVSSSGIVGPAIAAEEQEAKRIVSFGASWSAVDGLNEMNDPNQNNKMVGFDMNSYKAMRDDQSRTPFFEQAILERLGKNPESQVVLDLGTGPFCLFAVIAAQLGAGKVYALEANPEAAASARNTVEKMGLTDIIEVVEGYSTKVQLPEKVDFCIAEIVGSVASEEGACATIADAHRFLKDPKQDNNWIPCRIQTYASPASYTLHNLFGPPEFDWDKLNGEPVRFSCRDKGLELLSRPQLMEDIRFADLSSTASTNFEQSKLTFVVDKERLEENVKPLYDEFRQRSKPKESEQLAAQTAHSLSGIAMWPRLYLNDHSVIDSRQFETGNHQKSHWQTVLPVMSARPLGDLKGGETISINYKFELPADVTKPPAYSIQGTLDYATIEKA